MPDMIYLDYNATTPVLPEVAESLRPYLEEYFGNPSSAHWYGLQARKAVEKSRKQVALLLGCDPEEILFTSGGTESNNHAIMGYALAHKNRGNHIITSRIEHPAVTEVCRYLRGKGFEISYLPVDEFGIVTVEDLKSIITPQTILVSVMHANNEVGTIQPIREIAALAGEHGIAVHTDAAQSAGKITIDVKNLGVDLLSLAGHKFYAPKGIGVLYVRRGITLEKLIHGADHEMNRRAGTENVPEIVGLGAAAEIAKKDLGQVQKHLKKMRDRFENTLRKALPDIRINGHPEKRLPNTSSIGFPGIEAQTLLSELKHIAASAGAACHTGGHGPSPVLEAMGVPSEYAAGSIRFSTGRATTAREIDRAASEIIHAVKRIRCEKVKTGPATGVTGKIRLTQFTHGLGCACKIRPQDLRRILDSVPLPVNPDVLVSHLSSDDAAVYRINDHTAIVTTVDFFTPIVDDPYHFGTVAMANALSDIYAMGADPLFALNIVAFPVKRLPLAVLEDMIRGANDKAKEAGINILGGHSIEDTEPKFGMVITGVVHPDKILTNSTAKKGDSIILTKPVGTGILTTGMKQGMTDGKTEQFVIHLMETLNNTAARIIKDYPVSCCTDVTGFGLIGHLHGIATASRKNIELHARNVPVIHGARELVSMNVIPGGTRSNLEHFSPSVDWDQDITHEDRIMLADAQTSGGLVICVPEKYSQQLVSNLRGSGVPDASVIGQVTGDGTGRIRVRSHRDQ